MPDPSKFSKKEFQSRSTVEVRPKLRTPREIRELNVQQGGSVPFESVATEPWVTAITVQAAIEQLLNVVLGQYTKVITVTDDYTALVNDGVILVDASEKPITLTLPALLITAPEGKSYTVTKIDSSDHPVTLIDATGLTILGEVSMDICFQWTSITPLSDGSAWTAK